MDTARMHQTIDENMAKDLTVRAILAADMTRTLRNQPQTPAVRTLRARILNDLLGIPAGAFDPAKEQCVILLYENAESEAEVTTTFLVEGDLCAARKAGERLAQLRNCEYDVRPLEPLPPEIPAMQTLDRIAEIVEIDLMDAIERLDLIAKLVGTQAVAG